MQPTSPFFVAPNNEPNYELLRRMGWAVGISTGSYCVAWRGRDEVVFEWHSGAWHRIIGRGGVEEI
jgi:hypothetical protein